MNKNLTKLLALVLLSGLMIGCNTNKSANKDDSSQASSGEQSSSEPGPGPSSSEDEKHWSDEIRAEMLIFLGEELPFVQLDEASLEHYYDGSLADYGVGIYTISDQSATNLLGEYGDVLMDAGYAKKSTETQAYYSKTTDLGDLDVFFGWYEAEDEMPQGNYIDVFCPPYIPPVTEELLLEEGFTPVTGFPSTYVSLVMQDTGYDVPPVNQTGTWYYLQDLYEDEEEGWYYHILYLATYGEYEDDYATLLANAGMAYDEDYGCYYDPYEATDFEIYVYENNGWTLLEIYGPTLAPEEGEVVKEVENPDGSIVITFTFEGVLIDETDCGGRTFSSTSGSITCEKGNGGNNPKYYESSDTLRFYAKNTLEVNTITGYDISSVVLNIGSHKTMTGVASDFSVSKGSLVSENGVVTISNINAGSTLITFGHNASGGNIGLSSVVVTLVPIL